MISVCNIKGRKSGGNELENGGPVNDLDGIEQGVDNVLGSARVGLLFHRKPGGHTARMVNPNRPNK